MRPLPRIALLVAAVACSPATPTPEIGKPALPLGNDGGQPSLGFATPAKWTLTFSPRWRPGATLALDSGSTLDVGEGGERWIEHVAGEPESASSLAPEALVGIQQADGGYRFVGASGTVYVAREALGALKRASDPVAGARQVAVGKRAILVVDDQGVLRRSVDAGRTWTKVDVGGGSVVVDVAMLGDRGILVAAPQRFYGTKDDGVTWTPAKSPGIGVQTVVARDGALWVDGVEESMRFDPAWGTFQSNGGRRRTITRHPWAKVNGQEVVVDHLDGRRAMEIAGDPKARTWTLAIGEAGALGRPRKVDELDGCELVDFAARGDEIAVACDARGTVSGGIDKDASAPLPYYALKGRYFGRRSTGRPDGGSLGWITRVVRSSDAGRTFHVDTTVEGGIPGHGDVTIAIGAEDFVYLGRRCGPGYYAACLPARVRASRGAGFSDLPDEDAGDKNGQVAFATNAAQSLTYSVGMRDSEAFLYRWRHGSAVPEPVGRIATSIDPLSATLSLDDDGTVRGFARSGTSPIVFSYKDGGSLATTTLSIPVARGAFAGEHGLAVTAAGRAPSKAYESLDGGKTWGAVAAPAFVTNVASCSSYGCATDRGFRWGWDAPPGTPTGEKDASKAPQPQYAKPLRCSAKDRWVDLGGGNLPTIANVDHGGLRWVQPTRDKSGKIALLVSKRGEPTTKTTSVALLGVPPGPPKYGSGTVVHVQPDGVVAVRYSYKRERRGPGRYNPVDAQVVWYRQATGKVHRATVNKNPPFRVNRDPQDGYDREGQPSFTELPQVVALAQNGVYFHPASFYDEDDSGSGEPKRVPLMLLRDNGRIDKITIPTSVEELGGTAFVAQIDGTTNLLGRNPESFSMLALPGGKQTYYSVLGGLGDDDGAVDLVTLGGKPAFAATMRDPARAWLVGLRADPELGAATPIATQKSLGEVPKACDGAPSSDPSAYRIDAPYVLGSRRPVVVDSDGAAIVLATDRAEIRGQAGKPDACVAAFDAIVPSQDGDNDYAALVFTDDLSHSLLFRAATASWPALVSVRTMECQYQSGPLPEELEQVEGFTPDRRHAAVPRKRY
jgi:hypothetical protein